MLYITFITLLIVVMSGILSLGHHLKMLQQNSYLLRGYFTWLKESYTAGLVISAVFYTSISLSIIKGKDVLALVLAIVLALLRVIVSVVGGKKATKKLAFTVRVKRLYIAAIIITGVLVLVSAISSNVLAAEVCRTLCLLLSIVVPVLTVIAWATTYPIERMIKRSTNQKEQGIDDNALD